ncbi:MAG TPA: hypothetical protein VIV11_23115, partial [Kofleriaceae bacterium]
YGALSCNQLCSEGFDNCRRIGWQLRSVPGMGRIGGIWEDGTDLWLANQNGILRRRGDLWDPIVQPAGTPVWYHSIWAGGGHAFAAGDDGTVAHYDGTAWTSTPVAGTLLGIWGRSPTDVFAVGGKTGSGSIFHFDGSTWTEMSIETAGTKLLRGVWGTTNAVFAVGENGTILRLVGSIWSAMGSPTSHTLVSVWGSSASDVFAVGNDYATEGAAPVILRFNGIQWLAMDVPSDTLELNGVSGLSNREVFAVGKRDGSNILFYDGVGWTPMVSSVAGRTLSLQSVYAGPGGVYAAKRPDLFLEYAGAGRLEVSGVQSGGVGGIWATGPDYAIAVGDGLFFHEYINGAWGSVPYPPCWNTGITFVHDVWGPGPRDMWIVGPYGKMMRRTSGVQCVDIPNGKWIHDIWGSAAADVFAVGDNGTATDPNLLHFDGITWSDWSDRVSPFVKSLSGVWGFSATDVFVVGDSKVLRYDGSTWRDAGLVTTHTLKAIWGSSPTDVFAVGSEGAIFHYDGATWTQMVVPIGVTTPTFDDWVGVHGSGPNEVYAVGNRTLLRYDGTSWSPVSRLAPTNARAVYAVNGAVFVGGEGGIDPRIIGRLQ